MYYYSHKHTYKKSLTCLCFEAIEVLSRTQPHFTILQYLHNILVVIAWTLILLLLLGKFPTTTQLLFFASSCTSLFFLVNPAPETIFYFSVFRKRKNKNASRNSRKNVILVDSILIFWLLNKYFSDKLPNAMQQAGRSLFWKAMDRWQKTHS